MTTSKQINLSHDNYFSFRSSQNYNPYEDPEPYLKKDEPDNEEGDFRVK